MNFKEKLIDILDNILDLDRESIDRLIEAPADSSMGDLALPCFHLAKTLKKAPNVIASELKDKINPEPYFKKIEAVGPYLNFFYDDKMLKKVVVEEALTNGTQYGKMNIGNNQSVVIDYSSTNIAKPFHIGHIRSTLIGNALYNIGKRLGYNTIGVNHLGDYGTQFGLLITAFKKWSNKEEVEASPIDKFLELYVRINKEAEENPALRDEAHEWFKKLENKDEEAVKIWSWMKELSLIEFNRVYERLGINFDSYNGEAFYSDMLPAIEKELRDKDLITISDGCEIVDLSEFDMPPLMVKKSNGTSTYATRDLACAEYRKKTYDFAKNIYVVATQQNLHFKQLFKTLELMGYDWAKDCVHVGFGMVSLEDGTLSTRKGQVLYLEDVINKAVSKTFDLINSRNPDLENKEEVAEMVGIGALKFQEFYNQRIKDYVFSWDKTLSFEGETGPYVQYSYARCSSLINKSGIDPDLNDIKDELLIDEEINMLKEIYQIPSVVVDSFEKYEPYFISRQIIEVVKSFNRYYYNNQIITDDKELTRHRIAFASLVKTVIKSQLDLLGIATPERM
ncbi:MAG: arginine--tRNA ligase [Ezakiella sp.]|nr:arginine--tRNA ligase [Ezakiella sp.]